MMCRSEDSLSGLVEWTLFGDNSRLPGFSKVQEL